MSDDEDDEDVPCTKRWADECQTFSVALCPVFDGGEALLKALAMSLLRVRPRFACVSAEQPNNAGAGTGGKRIFEYYE